jgi:EAL domain-containing protein (putative c-di-GMP-specific phosphodiesterase class I)
MDPKNSLPANQVMPRSRFGWSGLQYCCQFFARQFKDFETIEMIQKILKESKLPGHLINRELTESTLIASHRNPQEILEELKNISIKLSIDDFESGYLSLSYLN